MKNGIYTIRDTKLGSSVQIFPAANDLTAMRQFQDIVNATGNVVNSHPEDYTLHHIGFWNDDTDEIVGHSPKQLAHAKEYKHEPES